MSKYLFILIFILILIMAIGLGIGIGYRARRREVGSKAAARDLRGGIAIMGVSVLILIGFYRFFPGLWRSQAEVVGSLIMTAVFLTFIVYWFRRKRQAGLVLLDLGRTRLQKIHLVAGVFMTASFIIGLVGRFLEAGGETGIKEISYFNLAMIFIGPLFLTTGLSHFEIRERGIFYLDRFVKWEGIGSFEWEGESGLTLTLRVRGRLSFFRTLSLPIPAIHKETVENLLEQNLPCD